MTTIVFRDGVMAADTLEDNGGIKLPTSKKIFIKEYKIGKGSRKAIMGTSGESFSGMLFYDWYTGPRKKKPPEAFDLLSNDEDFTILLWDNDKLYEVNKLCRPILIEAPFWAVGSGAGAALGAMHMGADALQAIKIASVVDMNTGGDVDYVNVKEL